MKENKTRLMVTTGVFAAMIFVATAFLHVNTNAGYTHFGDAVMFLAASVLPTPYAMAAAAIGEGLADAVSMPIWLPATVVIKALTVLLFTPKQETILCKRNLIAYIPALILCIVGYSLYEAAIMLGGWNTAALVKAFASTPAYFVQITGSAALYVVVGTALDKMGFKKNSWIRAK